MKRFLITFSLASLFLMSIAAHGAEKFPPPEFRETNHVFPQTNAPSLKLPSTPATDIGVFAAALAIGVFLTMVTRRRRWIYLTMLLNLGYFGFFRHGCICTVGSIQNVALAITDNAYSIPIIAGVFFALPLLVAFLFGRVFCGSVCPLGAIQDLVALNPIKIPKWISAPLSLIPWIVLSLSIAVVVSGGGFPICRWDPFVGIFRLDGPWRMLALGAAVLSLGIVIARPYCRFLCPYGVLLGLASRLSIVHMRIAPKECIDCRLCENSCPFGAIDEPTRGGVYKRREGIGKLKLSILALPIIIGIGLGSGLLLDGVISKTHPTIALNNQIFQEEKLASENREFKTTRSTDAWRGPAATARFNKKVDDFVIKPEWSKDPATNEILKDFRSQKAKDRNRKDLRISLLARRAELAEQRLSNAVIIAMIFVSCVGWLKLLALNIRRTRDEYTPNKTHCLSCGRCTETCPMEHARRKKGWF